MKLTLESTEEQDAAVQQTLTQAIKENKPPISLDALLAELASERWDAEVTRWKAVNFAPVLEKLSKNYDKLVAQDQADLLAILDKAEAAVEVKPQ